MVYSDSNKKSETPKGPSRQQKAKKISFSPNKSTGTIDPPDTGREITPENTLTRNTIMTIRQINNDDELANFAARNYNTREDHTLEGREYETSSSLDWFKWVYLTNRRVNKLTEDNKKDFMSCFNNAELKMLIGDNREIEEEFKKSEEERRSHYKKPSTGSGYSNQAVTCPGNILSDISRLEILIGGKRAGNNSAEINNEAADICRRFFAGGVMDINAYREIISELTENHRDAYEYHSD